ncbi:hypothetical protein KIW84_074639 [Lathyrus oleraceus]|uniref:Pentatricopeptide repeat-containing protein n=1 Tax=Pisum sativum TaxID=3888 RepID=A0A9D4VRS7_PEA|nr:hypothetical protein KIW84_074639 [Pisum sativum]
MELSTLSTSSNVMSGDGTTFDARLLDVDALKSMINYCMDGTLIKTRKFFPLENNFIYPSFCNYPSDTAGSFKVLEKHLRIKVFGTAQRLGVSIENLFTKQTEQEIEVRGPPVSKAFDQEGNPTKVVGVFSRKYAVPLDLVYRKVDGKTEYVYARIKESSRHAMEVLSEDLPATIAKFHFRRQCVGTHRKFDEALRYFGMMRRYGFEPDSVTITTAISSSALVDMYGKYGHLEMAIKVFEQMPKKSVVAWNSMIAGYGFKAENIFKLIPKTTAVSWNVMISGYVTKGKLLEALGLFSEMRQSSIEPDAIPFTRVLAACLQLAAMLWMNSELENATTDEVTPRLHYEDKECHVVPVIYAIWSTSELRLRGSQTTMITL